MNEFHEFIKKVMWYCEQEYEIPSVTVEEFEKSEHGNILINHCFNYFAENRPFQNCACSLVEYMKQLTNREGM
jgi:hypothetical protein